MGHEILIQCKAGHLGSPINLGYATMFGVGNSPFEMLGINARLYQVDVVILCVEIWAIDVKKLRHILPSHTLIISYFPNDTEVIPAKSLERLKYVDYIIPMSQHCKNLVFEHEGIKNDKLLEFIYPPISKVFRPIMDVDHSQITGTEKYDYLIGMVQMSKDLMRKDQIRQLYAVTKAAKITGKKIGLYLHMHHNAAFDLIDVAKSLDFVDNIILPVSDAYMSGFSDENMAKVYNSIDLLLQCTVGEGFGMPTAEAILSGTPVVGSLNTATKELIEMSWPEYGVKTPHLTIFRAFYDMMADFDDMIDKLVDAIENSIKDPTRADFLAVLVDPDTVANLWDQDLREAYIRTEKNCSRIPSMGIELKKRESEEVIVHG